MEALLFSVNAIFPLFVLLLLGFALRAGRLLDGAFVDSASRLLFNVAMPVMLFLNLLDTDVRQAFDWRLLAVIVGVLLLAVLLLRLIVPRFIREPAAYTAFIQGAFRGNLLIVGLPLAQALCGSQGVAILAMLLVVLAPLHTVIAVLVLSESTARKEGRHLLLTVISNPILIGCALGLVCSLAGATLPPLLRQPMDMLYQLVTPLSLIALGASVTIGGAHASVRQALCASLIKVALLPALGLLAAGALGLSGQEMAMVLVVFGAPAAVSCFPMAHQMGADHQLASLIIIFSNCLCVVTLFLFVFVLRWQGSI